MSSLSTYVLKAIESFLSAEPDVSKPVVCSDYLLVA